MPDVSFLNSGGWENGKSRFPEQIWVRLSNGREEPTFQPAHLKRWLDDGAIIIEGPGGLPVELQEVQVNG